MNMKRTLYEIPAPEDRTIIIPEDVYLAIEGKAEEEAKRIAGAAMSEDHVVARLITAKSLAQKILRNFAEKKCEGHYTPSKSRQVRGEGE